MEYMAVLMACLQDFNSEVIKTGILAARIATLRRWLLMYIV